MNGRLSSRGWGIAALAWLIVAFLQAPGRISADTKHDLAADPWGFLRAALYPWTDTFTFGQLQNQAYGYLFPQGLFFALGEAAHLPAWVTQRLWWALLLFLAFAGMLLVLEALSKAPSKAPSAPQGSSRPAGIGLPSLRTSLYSRLIAAVLYAASPRILGTLGAISSEAWTVALAPWVLLPVVVMWNHASGMTQEFAVHKQVVPTHGRSLATHLGRWRIPVRLALSSAVALLCMGAINAVATLAAALPAILFYGVFLIRGFQRGSAPEAAALTSSTPAQATLGNFTQHSGRAWKPMVRFGVIWLPASIAAIFWWVGPLLILGKYSPPFTDYIESASLTTRWLNVLEILRGTTSWVPFLSNERPAGNAQSVEPVFIVGTLAVTLIGLWGLMQVVRPRSSGAQHRTVGIALVITLVAGLLIMGLPSISEEYRLFLDGAGAPLRNLHKFDPLVRIPLLIGLAVALASVRPVSREALAHPERHPEARKLLATSLLMVVAVAPLASLNMAAADPYREVPTYWRDATAWINEQLQQPATEKPGANPAANPGANALTPRTLILPEARFARQTWGNTRDEPAQPLLDVPWAVRDSIPLVQPEAIRALDGYNTALTSGRPIPTLSATLRNAGVGFLLIRNDLTPAADTPGAPAVLRTVERTIAHSGGFRLARQFGPLTIYAVSPEAAADADAAPASDIAAPRLIGRSHVDRVTAGPEALTRLDELDAALGRDPSELPRVRELMSTDTFGVTDTPGLRDHNYGNVHNADSALQHPDDDSEVLNPVRDYVARSAESEDVLPRTEVQLTGGTIRASSTADTPTNFGGADTASSLTSLVDGSRRTGWRPAPGAASGQWVEFQLPEAHARLSLDLWGLDAPARIQVTTSTDDGTVVASTTTVVRRSAAESPTVVAIPGGAASTIRLTILSAFGSTGLAEARIYDADGADITPSRVAVMPSPAGTESSTTRWLFGQEIHEGLLLRRFTTQQEHPVVVHTDACADTSVQDTTGQDTAVQDTTDSPLRHDALRPGDVHINGKVYRCGDVLDLPAGTHELASLDTWVSLTVAEPLYAAAVANAPSGFTLEAAAGEAPGSFSAIIPQPTTEESILFLPSQANPGRVAVLNPATSNAETIELQSIRVNGWQQGWIVPAGVSGTVSVTFAPTDAYRMWLGIGLGLALALVLVWLLVWIIAWVRRGTTQPSAPAPAESLPPVPLARWERVTFGIAATVAIIGAARSPWGSLTYAGDSWFLSAALLVPLLLVIRRLFLR